MKPRDYCCWAIPIVNAGIYATLLEQLTLAIVVAVLSLGTPSIVGAATPSFASALLAVASIVVAAIQVLGILGVRQEKPILYRRYVTLHGLFSSAAFSIAATWVIISASRHSTAENNCINDFFPASNGTVTSSEAQGMCNTFPWLDVGVMGALWIFLAVAQLYFYFVVSSYGKGQRRDHAQYEVVTTDVTLNPLTAKLSPTNRRDPWELHPSDG